MSKTVDFMIEEAQYIAAKKAGDTLSEPERARAELVVRLWEKEAKSLLRKGIDIANSGSLFRIKVYTDGTYVGQLARSGKKNQPADEIPDPKHENIYRLDHLGFMIVSLSSYLQEVIADLDTDPKAAEVRRAMGTTSIWLQDRFVETRKRRDRGLPPRSPRPLK